MCGHFSEDKFLSQFAKREAQNIKVSNLIKQEDPISVWHISILECVDVVCGRVIKAVGSDLIHLILLSVFMAVVSFIMDVIIYNIQQTRIQLSELFVNSIVIQYFCWILFPIVCVCFATGFVHIVGPNAIGSGIPEMKTIIRGISLQEYLTFPTLLAKVVGLCACLGCGLPIGKEGPFVHLSSIMCALLGKFIYSLKSLKDESQHNDMLTAASAVGVACTFAAPFGGLLFSIEVTATHFIVENYWNGFLAAVLGAVIYRIISVIFTNEDSVTALFYTQFAHQCAYSYFEIPAFVILGLFCGFLSALFVYCHAKYVEIIRSCTLLKKILQLSRFLYPSLIVLFISSLTFSEGFGQFMAGKLGSHDAICDLFSNFTWFRRSAIDNEEQQSLSLWAGPTNNIFLTLVLFVVFRLMFTVLCATLPIPGGIFIPVFVIGAAIGRLFGEVVQLCFPEGINDCAILPGGYAVVGAAAFAGGVTHTISTAIIVFEVTGQMIHILPCVIGVLCSNAVAVYFQPSFYDSLIKIKKLPYLPRLTPTMSSYQKRITVILVKDFMVKDLTFISKETTIKDLVLLVSSQSSYVFPVVSCRDAKILIGSVKLSVLRNYINRHLARIDDASSFNSFKKNDEK